MSGPWSAAVLARSVGTGRPSSSSPPHSAARRQISPASRRGTRWRGTTGARRGGAGQGELRVVLTSPSERLLGLRDHHVGGPRRHVGQHDLDAVDRSAGEEDAAHLVGQVLTERARRRRRRQHDARDPVVDIQPVDQTERDDVDAELGVDDVAQRLAELFRLGPGPSRRVTDSRSRLTLPPRSRPRPWCRPERRGRGRAPAGRTVRDGSMWRVPPSAPAHPA